MNKQNKKPRRDDMYEAILTLETIEECKRFFDDLCTVTELQAMEQRYQVAVYLSQGMIYNDILERTGASSATISRVNRSLQYGADGYAVAFERLKAAGKFGGADSIRFHQMFDEALLCGIRLKRQAPEKRQLVGFQFPTFYQDLDGILPVSITSVEQLRHLQSLLRLCPKAAEAKTNHE